MSELVVGDIRCFRPALVREARDRVETQRQRLGRAMTELLAARPQATAWSGPAAGVAFTRNADAVQALGALAHRLGHTAEVLTSLAQKMQACLALVRHADRRAAEAGGWLNHEGQLFLPEPPPVCVDPALVAHRARQQALLREEITRDLRQAVALARLADHEAVGRLAAAASGTASAPAMAGSLAAPSPPPLRRGPDDQATSAFANAAWWRALTPSEKGVAIREHPEWVGPRDGVPGWARHEANLVLLGLLEDAAARDLAAAEDRRYDGQAAKRAHLAWQTQRVESLHTVRQVISQADGVPRQLLFVDDTGPIVQAAVAVGDVDRAQHVTTFVGGFTTTVRGSLPKMDRESTAMRAEAAALARDGGGVAVVDWLGYPAPQTAGVTQPGASVLGEALSRGYSDELAAFLNGLDAARDTPMHSTLAAHSYGSNVAGHALLENVSVDDVVLYGSPGVPFRELEDTGLKPDALNVLAAPDDWIPKAGPLVLGTPPAAVTGARRLATLHVKGMPNDLRTAAGHSEYRAPGTVARRNIVAVMAGRPDVVIPASREESRPTGGVQGPRPDSRPVVAAPTNLR